MDISYLKQTSPSCTLQEPIDAGLSLGDALLSSPQFSYLLVVNIAPAQAEHSEKLQDLG